jgi:predicted PurR-regulated permease PerM
MLRDSMVGSSIIVIHELGFRVPAQLNLQPEPAIGAVSGSALDLSQVINAISSALFVAISVLVLAYYWTLNGERTLRALLLRVPMDSRENVRQIINTMEGKVGAFLRGQAILCLSVSGAMLTALIIIQLPYALSLALLAGVFEAVPILGPTLGAVPALLVALATAPDKVVWVIVAVIIIQQLESNILIPRIMDKSVGVNPIVTILSIIAFGLLLGLPGTLMAIPLAAIIQVVISYIVFEPSEPLPKEEGRGRASVLRYEAQQLREDVRKQVRQKDDVVDGQADRIEDLIESIASDVDGLLADRDNSKGTESGQ